MQKIFMLCDSENSYKKQLNYLMGEGYRFVPGSTFVKSLGTNVTASTGVLIKDTEHIFSAAVRGDKDVVVMSKDLNNFVSEVNKLLNTENILVLGSLSVDESKLDGYMSRIRAMVTYYGCYLEKY